MNERIKELAEKAGLSTILGNNWLYGEQLEEFAELVRQDEREANAKLCEKIAYDYTHDRNEDGYDWPNGDDCAAAIRARNNE